MYILKNTAHFFPHRYVIRNGEGFFSCVAPVIYTVTRTRPFEKLTRFPKRKNDIYVRLFGVSSFFCTPNEPLFFTTFVYKIRSVSYHRSRLYVRPGAESDRRRSSDMYTIFLLLLLSVLSLLKRSVGRFAPEPKLDLITRTRFRGKLSNLFAKLFDRYVYHVDRPRYRNFGNSLVWPRRSYIEVKKENLGFRPVLLNFKGIRKFYITRARLRYKLPYSTYLIGAKLTSQLRL